MFVICRSPPSCFWCCGRQRGASLRVSVYLCCRARRYYCSCDTRAGLCVCALSPPIVLCICATTLCVCLTSPMEGCVFWQFASMRCSCYRLCVLCGTTVPVGQCPVLCVCTLSSNLVVDICLPWCVGLRVRTSPMECCRSTFRAPIYVGCVRLFRVRCTMCP